MQSGKLLIFARYNELPMDKVSVSVDWSVIDYDIKAFAEDKEVKNVEVKLEGMQKESLLSGLRRRIKTLKLVGVNAIGIREGQGDKRHVVSVWLVKTKPISIREAMEEMKKPITAKKAGIGQKIEVTA